MKRAILFVLILAGISSISLAQTKSDAVTVQWGDEEKASKRSTLSDIIGYDDTGVYVLKIEYGRMGLNSTETIEFYDGDMNFQRELELGDVEFVVYLNNQIFVFSSEKNKKAKKNILYSQSINKKTLQLNNDKKEIAEIDFSEYSRFNAGSFGYQTSRDSSKLFVSYNLPYERRGSERFGFHVFDNNLDQIWQKRITLPYTDELFSIEDYEVDNDGNVHVIGVAYKDKRKAKRKGAPNYSYHILTYENNGIDMSDNIVEVEGKFLTDMKIAVTKDLDILCGGFYSALGTFSIEGSYFLKIDGDSYEIVSESFEDFGIDFITQNMSNRQERKAKRKDAKGKDVEMYEYDLDDIILKEDGGAILIGEQYFVNAVTSTSTDSNGNTRTSTTYYYHYNDIIIINIAPDGSIVWTEKIGKVQITTNDHGFFSSYALSVVKDKLYFVFNDNSKNLFYTGEGKLYNIKRGKESLVVLVTLDSEGNQKREALFSMREADILTRPKVCEQISATEMVVFGQYKKSHRLGKITFLD
jgi:hypothetical protein